MDAFRAIVWQTVIRFLFLLGNSTAKRLEVEELVGVAVLGGMAGWTVADLYNSCSSLDVTCDAGWLP